MSEKWKPRNRLPQGQEADAGVAIDAVVEYREAGNGRDRFVLRHLDDGERARLQPAAGRQSFERRREQSLPIRRIEKGEIERRQRVERPELRRIAAPDLARAREIESLHIVADEGARLRRIVDEEAIARAPRQRLEAERAGAGKEIDHARVLQGKAVRQIPVFQDVEHRRADLVRGRPKPRIGGRLERPALETSGNDPHRFFNRLGALYERGYR